MPSKMKAVVMEGFGSAEVLHLGVVERPAPHQVLPLEEAAAAHRIMEASAHFGKIVLQVDSS